MIEDDFKKERMFVRQNGINKNPFYLAFIYVLDFVYVNMPVHMCEHKSIHCTLVNKDMLSKFLLDNSIMGGLIHCSCITLNKQNKTQ